MEMPPDLTIRMSPHHRSPLEGVRLAGERVRTSPPTSKTGVGREGAPRLYDRVTLDKVDILTSYFEAEFARSPPGTRLSRTSAGCSSFFWVSRSRFLASWSRL